jgi:Rod binding domain-containing protein
MQIDFKANDQNEFVSRALVVRKESESPEARAAKKKAYEDFEALLLGDVLKNLRGSLGGSWLGEEAGAGTDAIMEMAEQQMVKVMASQDVLGLVRSLEKKL